MSLTYIKPVNHARWILKFNGAVMAGLFSKLLGKKSQQMQDAERIYNVLLAQARKPAFYGEGRVPDTYDGRIDFLTLNIAVALRAIRPFGEDGRRLSQAIFDVMKDDFDVALREEGISDKGVAKRIKPMMKLFYTRLKAYDTALNSSDPVLEIKTALAAGLLSQSHSKAETDQPHNKTVEGHDDFAMALADYIVNWSKRLSEKTLGEIALCEMEITEFSE